MPIDMSDLEKIRLWDQSGLNSWKYNEETGKHEPPVVHPHDALELELGFSVDRAESATEYTWDEATKSWIEVSDV